MAEIDELTKRARAIEIKLLDVVLLDAYARRVDAPEQAVRLISDLLARLRKAETDNAHMARLLSGYQQICTENGIAPPSSDIYAAAERAGGRNG